MKVIDRTYKYRLYPNRKQAALLAEHFGCTRFVYNYFLNQRKEQYKNTKKSDNYYAQAKALAVLKKILLISGLMKSMHNLFSTLLETLIMHIRISLRKEPGFQSSIQRNMGAALLSRSILKLKVISYSFQSLRKELE